MSAKRKLQKVESTTLLKLDLGCGKNKREGFLGVDSRQFDGKVDVVHDLTTPWPWADGSVEEAHCSHFIEHLTGPQRVHFVNELYRVLIPGGKATVVTPHWASNRAYGDMTHKWPPVSEMWFYYLDKDWRAQNAPHNDFYTCNFNCTWGYSLHPQIQMKAQEAQGFAMQFYKEAAQDMICTMTKK
jgi:SAM-dependent methyltransferase